MSDSTDLVIRLSGLSGERPFDLRPGEEARTEMAERLGLSTLRKLRFAGRLVPEGRADWRLEAALGATVVQPCSVTLEPVTTRIDESLTRRYLARLPDLPEGEEVEMSEDDIEALPEVLDLTQVMEEALALALPLFPRAEGVELGEAVFSEPGTAPMRDEDARPFAGLADLKRKLEGDDAD